MTPSRRAAAVAPLLLLTLTACAAGGGTDPEAAPSASPSATGTPPATTPAPTPTVARPTMRPVLVTDLADGKHYAHLKAYATAKGTLTVDVVQFLTGEAAEKAAQEDGAEAFDYYVRNQNPKLRTLTVAANVKITVNTLAASESGSSSKDVAVTPAKLASYLKDTEARMRVFWFRLKGGVVTEVHEQYLP